MAGEGKEIASLTIARAKCLFEICFFAKEYHALCVYKKRDDVCSTGEKLYTAVGKYRDVGTVESRLKKIGCVVSAISKHRL